MLLAKVSIVNEVSRDSVGSSLELRFRPVTRVMIAWKML
jgi:hypothetical protein